MRSASVLDPLNKTIKEDLQTLEKAIVSVEKAESKAEILQSKSIEKPKSRRLVIHEIGRPEDYVPPFIQTVDKSKDDIKIYEQESSDWIKEVKTTVLKKNNPEKHRIPLMETESFTQEAETKPEKKKLMIEEIIPEVIEKKVFLVFYSKTSLMLFSGR